MNNKHRIQDRDLEDEKEKLNSSLTWNRLYVLVVIYTVLLIGLLYVVTILLDHSSS